MDELRHYAKVAGRSWRVLLVTALIAAVAAVGVSLALPRTYESEARLLVSEPESSVNVFGSSLPELAAQKENGVQTQAELLRSRTLFAAVIAKLGLNDSPESLMRRVKVGPVNQTSVIAITARATSADTAAQIANALAEEYLARFRTLKQDSLRQAADAVQTEITKLQTQLQAMDANTATQVAGSVAAERKIATDRLGVLSAKLQELQVNQQVEQGWGMITDKAVAVNVPVGPTPLSSGLLGLLAGTLFGIVYVIFQDARVREPELYLPEASTLLLPPIPMPVHRDEPAARTEVAIEMPQHTEGSRPDRDVVIEMPLRRETEAEPAPAPDADEVALEMPPAPETTQPAKKPKPKVVAEDGTAREEELQRQLV